jgi:signal transduction histidine kinase
MSDHPHLSISSHVVVQLGEELVTDVEQALLELAKNAYDADSETCEIVIEPDWVLTSTHPAYEMLFGERADSERIDEVVGRIQIIDQGDGLSESAVRDGWLRISASLKRPNLGAAKAKTTKGRTLVGDKGLGRLATMKIGTVLRLKTAVEGESAWRTVTFSWNSFTPDRTLEMVPVSEGYEPRSDTYDKGTIIEIVGLRDRDRWDVDRIERELLPKLSSLITPFEETLSFSVTIRHGKHFFELSPLAPEVLNLAAARFEFSWDGSVLTQQAWIDETLFRGKEGAEARDSFESVFPAKADAFFHFLADPKRLGKRGIQRSSNGTWFIELMESEELQSLPTHKKLPGAIDPGPFKAEFYYFLLLRENIQKLRTAGITSSEQMKAMAGIGIFRDGFRISTDRDWIGIAEGQTSGTSYYGLRPSNTVGYVTISNEYNPRLIEKSDREAFVDNPEFRGFMSINMKCRDHANGILEVLRRSFNLFRKEQFAGSPTFQTPKSLLASVASASDAQPRVLLDMESEFVSALERSLTNTRDQGDTESVKAGLRESAKQLFRRTAETVQQRSEQISSHSKALAIHWEDTNEQNLRLIDAAAAGLSARSLAHELHQYVRQYREGVDQVSEKNKQYKDPIIKSAVRLLSSTTRELGKTVSGIDPLLPGSRALKEKFLLYTAIANFVEARKDKASSRGIAIRFEVGHSPSDFEIRFSRSRFLQILENLFQNSLYWVKRGPPGRPSQEIVVEATSNGFVWSDSGPGIKPSLEGTIFDAFVSDKPNDEGQGLGLHIITTFLELDRCAIRLTHDKNSLGRRYKFEVDLSSAKPEAAKQNLF